MSAQNQPARPPSQPTAPVLYTGIVLYSADDPEASAMLVADGLIAWTGPEDSALVLHPEAERVDATGRLVTPGFVDAAATTDGTDPDPAGDAAAAAHGIVLRLPGPTGTREGVQVIAPVTEDAAFLDLVSDGTPLAFGSAGRDEAADPWTWVRAAARTAPAARRLSDRAAFLAASRGGQRVAGRRHPGTPHRVAGHVRPVGALGPHRPLPRRAGRHLVHRPPLPHPLLARPGPGRPARPAHRR
uniref:hypothetical protein n=1 Tax=Brachybacterium sp. GPGPB12 TaxID=3023517 RepID=UPI004049A111